MVYNYKEYSHVFDTPAKKQQEMAIVNKIMELLNNNKYDNIEEFIAKNQTYQDFLQNNKLENVIKHFGNTLNEEDYLRIVDSMKKLTKDKQQFDKSEIKTTNIGDKQYNYFKSADKEYFLDNSHSEMSIERQMEELQKTQQQFQSSDKMQNTESMMKELEENKKESFNLKYLKDFEIDLLNEKQKKVFDAAIKFQLELAVPIRIDIDRQVIVDENNNIFRLENNNGEFFLMGDKSETKSQEKTDENVQEKTQSRTLQKSMTLTPTNNN